MGLRMATPWQRDKAAPYYLRQRVPSDLAQRLKGVVVSLEVAGELVAVKLGADIKVSLRTKDAKLAKERYTVLSAALQQLWGRYRAVTVAEPSQLTPKQIEALAGQFYGDMCAIYEDDPVSKSGEWRHAVELARERQGNPSQLEKALGHFVDDTLLQHGLTAGITDRLALLEAFNRASARIALFQAKRADGDYSPDPNALKFPRLGGQVPSQSATETLTLDDLFARWEAEHQRGEGAARTPQTYRACLDSLATFVGHRDATRITPRMIADWTESLMTGEEALSPKTVKAKYLVAVKTVFGAGVRSQLLAENPSKDVQVRVRKQKVLRDKGYSDAEAKMILRAAGRIRDDSPRHNELSKRSIEWGPWIAAHTGARISEVMQLRKQDFEHHDGLPCIRITPEAGAVKNGEFRIVPLHRQLIERGLLEFVRASQGDYLFIKGDEDLAVVRDRAGRAGSMVSKWVREVVGLTDENIQPNHA